MVGNIDSVEDWILGDEVSVSGTEDSEALGDVIDLVNIRVSRKDWVSRQHLSIKTSNSPDINLNMNIVELWL